jgi:hypothetical protein
MQSHTSMFLHLAWEELIQAFMSHQAHLWLKDLFELTYDLIRCGSLPETPHLRYHHAMNCNANACKMHPWSLHFTTWYSTLFASYMGYIHAFWWLLGIIHMFPNFIKLTWENQKSSFLMFLTFRDPNEIQMAWNFGKWVFRWNKTSKRRRCNRGATRAKRARPTLLDSLAAWGLLVPPL